MENPVHCYRQLSALSSIDIQLEFPATSLDPQQDVLSVHSKNRLSGSFYDIWRQCVLQLETRFILVFKYKSPAFTKPRFLNHSPSSSDMSSFPSRTSSPLPDFIPSAKGSPSCHETSNPANPGSYFPSQGHEAPLLVGGKANDSGTAGMGLCLFRAAISITCC